MDTQLNATIVIPAHNAEKTIATQLSALAGQQGAPPFEVIVVANNCSDRTVDIANGFREKLTLTVLLADDRAGPAYARNTGVALAGSEIVLHCDADDRVDCNWVQAMVDALQDFDVVGGVARIPTGIDCWFADPALYDRDDLQTSRGVRYALTACIGYHRRVHQAVGGFDERFLSAEDVAFCLQADRNGFELGFSPRATIDYTPRKNAFDTIRQKYAYGSSEALLHATYMPEELRSLAVEVLSGSRAIVRSAPDLLRPSRRRAAVARGAALLGRTVSYVSLARAGHWPSSSRH